MGDVGSPLTTLADVYSKLEEIRVLLEVLVDHRIRERRVDAVVVAANTSADAVSQAEAKHPGAQRYEATMKAKGLDGEDLYNVAIFKKQ